jgi:hypothetical protein
LVWESRKSQQQKKGSVVLKDLGFVDSPQAHHDGEEKREDEIGRKVVDIALRNLHGALQQATKTELFAKTLKQNHSPKVS